MGKPYSFHLPDGDDGEDTIWCARYSALLAAGIVNGAIDTRISVDHLDGRQDLPHGDIIIWKKDYVERSDQVGRKKRIIKRTTIIVVLFLYFQP